MYIQCKYTFSDTKKLGHFGVRLAACNLACNPKKMLTETAKQSNNIQTAIMHCLHKKTTNKKIMTRPARLIQA